MDVNVLPQVKSYLVSMTGLIYVLAIILAMAIITINLLVCVTIYLHKELRCITNYLIVSLAVADLGVGALAIPFSMVLSMEYTLYFYTCLFLTCFPLVTTQFSILLLLVIAIHTHLKIKLPNRQVIYPLHVKKCWVIFIVAFCWLLSLLIGLSPVMGWNRFHYSRKFLVYFIFLICTLLPLAAMLGIYGDIFRVVRDHFRSQPLWPAKKKEMQMACTLLLLVGVFFICWMPLHMIYCIQLLCPSCEQYEFLERLAVLLSHLNSLANPLVYALRKKNLGLALRSVWLGANHALPAQTSSQGCCCGENRRRKEY
uniref:G-protein coupled receptors family 1 profile domain-containing protein n=1 Tax=Laticauda laticaudata TaxID=8630 RepID=A0A8C5SW25_LATLA